MVCALHQFHGIRERLDAARLYGNTVRDRGVGRPNRRPTGYGAAAAMTRDERREFEAELARLRQEHRDLDTAIEALHHAPGSDILQVQRLKKRKLQLRDRMTFIEDQLTPDIIA
jgi:hypothetical protein